MGGNMAAGSCLTIFWAFLWVAIAHGEKDFPLAMPRVHPATEESYICTPIRLSDTQTFYVNRFTPNASAHTAHHMLIYGCDEPGSLDYAWNCGEMAQAQEGKELHQPCKSGNQIIYAWAMDAPELTLPPSPVSCAGQIRSPSSLPFCKAAVRSLSPVRSLPLASVPSLCLPSRMSSKTYSISH